MEIYVLRHGQTDLNVQKRVQARNGLPLNDVGLEQAFAAAERLAGIKFDLVFSSLQERAVQTARIAARCDRVITDERLEPFDAGSADNLPIDDNLKLVKGLIPDPNVYEGVEEPDAFVSRVYAFMDELKDKYGGSDTRILIAGHKCTTGCIETYFNGMPEDGDFFAVSAKNGAFRRYEL